MAQIRLFLMWVAGGFGAVGVLPAMSLLVPAYFYPVPGSPWEALALAAPRAPIVAILNPGNGPGTVVDNNYVRVIGNFRRAGGRVIGYVYSSYTRRPLAEVKVDVDRYYSFYAIDGIFVDEMDNSTNAASYAYYAELYGFIKARSAAAWVVSNPGINTQEPYLSLPCTDALVTFENHLGYPEYQTDAWTARYPSSRFAHLGYQVPDAAGMTNFVNLAASRNVGFVFVTDDTLPNPWDSLPPYWEAEVGWIAQLNRPRLDLIRLAGGTSRLDVAGASGVRYVCEFSTNFSQWTPYTTNQADSGAYSVTNPPAPLGSIFYRARE